MRAREMPYACSRAQCERGSVGLQIAHLCNVKAIFALAPLSRSRSRSRSRIRAYENARGRQEISTFNFYRNKLATIKKPVDPV